MPEFRLELVLLPVTDVDRARDFYVQRCGFHLDVDHRGGDRFRVVQMTPPGSPCSITIGVGLTDAQPGSVRGLHLVVPDIEVAHAFLRERGVPINDIWHIDPASGRQPGPHPGRDDYGSFADFTDPDGNTWLIQERRTAPPPPPAG